MTTFLAKILTIALIVGAFVVPSAGIAWGVMRLARRDWSWRRNALVAFIFGLLTAGTLQLLSLDGLVGTFFSLAEQDTTQYAPQYSPIGFRIVSTEMSAERVKALAGEPLEEYDIAPGLTGWRWSRSPSDSSYHVRAVLFRNGRVVEKHAEYYFD